MDIIHDIVIPCICSFVACAAFGVQFNIRFKHLIAASVGSLVSQLIYTLLSMNEFGEIQTCFISAAAVALFSEVMAKINKAPVNMYLIVGIIPLVPGGLTYYAMLALVMGDNDTFLDRAIDAFGAAGAIAMGIFFVSSAVRLYKDFRRHYRRNLKKAYKKLSAKDGRSVKKF
ncbi:MAG: threonine/serine exporter family protein [Oscillospiraceae bacterium]|nr:threonine/serine exporter family protein [Oscillospiraceae bacterium]MDY3793320.1 threonine/serine exporter family protein [Oscillospiraceae bacterium]MDY6208321.1 threonine/serine exporter family protein [Oscillospiraceae bacterium]